MIAPTTRSAQRSYASTAPAHSASARHATTACSSAWHSRRRCGALRRRGRWWGVGQRLESERGATFRARRWRRRHFAAPEGRRVTREMMRRRAEARAVTAPHRPPPCHAPVLRLAQRRRRARHALRALLGVLLRGAAQRGARRALDLRIERLDGVAAAARVALAEDGRLAGGGDWGSGERDVRG